MAIFRGSTTKIRTVLSTNEIDWEHIEEVHLYFAQKDDLLSDLTSIFYKTDAEEFGLRGFDSSKGTITFVKDMTQEDTTSLLPDEDLLIEVNVFLDNGDRRISKKYAFAVCDTLNPVVVEVTNE